VLAAQALYDFGRVYCKPIEILKNGEVIWRNNVPKL
jgi:hypothetical protein